MDISGLSKEEVFAALYNAAISRGLGFLHYDPKPISAEEAEEIMTFFGDDNRRIFGSLGPEYNDGLCFDYVYGRVLKVDLTFDDVAVYAYNEANGEGVAERAIWHLRTTGEVVCPAIIEIQNSEILKEALEVLDDIDRSVRVKILNGEYDEDSAAHFRELRDAVKKAISKLPE